MSPHVCRTVTGLLATAAAVALVLAVPATADPGPGDPPWSVPVEELAASVDCVGEAAADVEPVVLVHGTFTEGHEQYAWNYELRLADEAIPYCVVTYPDRGMGDMQVSAEHVAYAVQEAARTFGSDAVDLVGHSQGASMPRWAIRYWPSVQALLDDVVLHAGPNHGTTVAAAVDPLGRGKNPSSWQFEPGSDFNWYVNQGDETPGDADYTSIYATTDELVQPSYGPDATAILDGAVNVNVNEVCPGRVVDHLTLGTTDAFVMALTVDALRRPGPAPVDDLAFVANLCSLSDQYVTPATLAGFGDAGGAPSPDDYQYETTDAEPPVRAYAVERDGPRP